MIRVMADFTLLNIVSAEAAAGMNVQNGAPVALSIEGDIFKATAVGATASAAFPAFYGSQILDAQITGKLPVITANGYAFITDQYDTGASWALGADVTAKDGKWTVAASGEPVVGRVVKVPTANDATVGIYFKG